MPFNTKGGWENIKRLMVVGTSRHTSTRLILTRLTSGRLEENNKENVSAFAKSLLKSAHQPQTERQSSHQ